MFNDVRCSTERAWRMGSRKVQECSPPIRSRQSPDVPVIPSLAIVAWRSVLDPGGPVDQVSVRCTFDRIPDMRIRLHHLL